MPHDNTTKSDSELRLQIQDILYGADAVHDRLKSVYNSLSPSLKHNIFQFKSRVKSETSIYNKILNRKKTNYPDYTLRDIMDVIGCRFITLYGDELFDAFNTAIEFLTLCQSEHIGIIGKSALSSNIVEIKVFHRRNDSGSDPYLKAYRDISSHYQDFPIQQPELKIEGYSSIHIIVNCSLPESNSKRFYPLEMQIRTAFEDIWADVSHELKYKNSYIVDGNNRALSLLKEKADKEVTLLKNAIDIASERADGIKNDYNNLDEILGRKPASAPSANESVSIFCHIIRSSYKNFEKAVSSKLSAIDRIHYNNINRSRSGSSSFAVDHEKLGTILDEIKIDIQNQNISNDEARALINFADIYFIYYEVYSILSSSKNEIIARSDKLRLRHLYDLLLSIDGKATDAYRLWVESLILQANGSLLDEIGALRKAYRCIPTSKRFCLTELDHLIPRDLAYSIFVYYIEERDRAQLESDIKLMSTSDAYYECLRYAINSTLNIHKSIYSDEDYSSKKIKASNNIISYFSGTTRPLNKKDMKLIKEAAAHLIDEWSRKDLKLEKYALRKMDSLYASMKILGKDTEFLYHDILTEIERDTEESIEVINEIRRRIGVDDDTYTRIKSNWKKRTT